jgi:hypothetical protein
VTFGSYHELSFFEVKLIPQKEEGSMDAQVKEMQGILLFPPSGSIPSDPESRKKC